MSLDTETPLPPEYETLHVGVILYDPSTGRIVDGNPRLEGQFGYAIDELRRMAPDRYSANTYSFSGAELTQRIRAAAEGDHQRFKWRVKRGDGELIWVRMHLSAFDRGGHRYVLAEVQDITDYYTASQRVGLLSRIMRHNLRNDVTVIAGRAEQLEQTTEKEARSNAATIRSKAATITEMIESIKAIERATTSGNATRSLRNVADAIRDVIADVRREHPAAQITVDERTPLWIHVDEAFDRALRQAIENAVVHSDSEAPAIDVAVDTSPNTGRVEIMIADRNPPIPPCEIAAIDEFSETTSTDHGSGVGLFVMKWCIESLGGELKIEPRNGKGNVVSFYLPPKTPPGE